MSARLLARWESRSKKHWVEVRVDRFGPYYTGPDCGGGFSSSNELSAIEEIQMRVDRGHFQPDKAKTLLKRTAWPS